MYRMSNIFNFLKYVDDIYFITVCISDVYVMLPNLACNVFFNANGWYSYHCARGQTSGIKVFKVDFRCLKNAEKNKLGCRLQTLGITPLYGQIQDSRQKCARPLQGLYRKQTIILIILYLSKNK